ncbi:MAG: SulP family inorganic anion transporter, partial [Bacteroidota bacterium]
RSAVNNEVGGRTGLSSIVTALLMALTLLFLTPIFYYLPNAVLASIILMAVWGLFDYQEALYLWKTHRQDFYMMLVTFLVTLFIGIEEGVLAGVILSLFLVLFRSARPHIAVLGQIPKTKSYRNISRFPEALQSKELLILRFDAQLYFGNVTAFKDRIKIEVAQRLPDLQLLILDASSIHEMDSSGLAALQEVVNSLKRKEIDFYICGVIGPVRDLLHQSGVAEHIGAQNQFLYVHDAVRHFQTTADDHSNWNKHALQNNIKRSDP